MRKSKRGYLIVIGISPKVKRFQQRVERNDRKKATSNERKAFWYICPAHILCYLKTVYVLFVRILIFCLIMYPSHVKKSFRLLYFFPVFFSSSSSLHRRFLKCVTSKGDTKDGKHFASIYVECVNKLRAMTNSNKMDILLIDVVQQITQA